MSDAPQFQCFKMSSHGFHVDTDGTLTAFREKQRGKRHCKATIVIKPSGARRVYRSKRPSC